MTRAVVGTRRARIARLVAAGRRRSCRAGRGRSAGTMFDAERASTSDVCRVERSAGDGRRAEAGGRHHAVRDHAVRCRLRHQHPRRRHLPNPIRTRHPARGARGAGRGTAARGTDASRA